MAQANIPNVLEKELHPLCDRAILARILNVINSAPASCIQEVADTVGCSDVTAKKYLERIVKAGLAVEKRIGKARVFIPNKPMGEHFAD
jgi:response regulator of citrate/malate metabolism